MKVFSPIHSCILKIPDVHFAPKSNQVGVHYIRKTLNGNWHRSSLGLSKKFQIRRKPGSADKYPSQPGYAENEVRREGKERLSSLPPDRSPSWVEAAEDVRWWKTKWPLHQHPCGNLFKEQSANVEQRRPTSKIHPSVPGDRPGYDGLYGSPYPPIPP
ncbi:hypothetical protein WA026_009768 [Henosepilachna vigintioctopunctata]|uniref:Uncharacterized protein n=1 Tax=Henosepilachna vigintioctopunctata TaxID=420089 RepID=A0AAW1TQ95_9CUCU